MKQKHENKLFPIFEFFCITSCKSSAQITASDNDVHKAKCQQRYQAPLQSIADSIPDSVTELCLAKIGSEEIPDLSRFKNLKRLEFEDNAFSKIFKKTFISQKLENVRIESFEVEHIRFPKNKTIKKKMSV
jgi:hypothetical protein